MNRRAQTINGLFKHGLMFSFSVGKVHYHTLKSDIISFLIFCLFGILSFLFNKTLRLQKKIFKQENENTTLCKMKTTGFQMHQEKNTVYYIYFHHFHVLWKIDSYTVSCQSIRNKCRGTSKGPSQANLQVFFNWNINYDIIFKIKTIWQNKYPTQLWPRARPKSKPDIFYVCISNLAYFFKRIEESRTKLRKPAYL